MVEKSTLITLKSVVPYDGIDPQDVEDNFDLKQGEIESLMATLNTEEFQCLYESPSSHVTHDLILNICPNSDSFKVTITDKSNKDKVELRSLPIVTCRINLTQAYPSHQAPFVEIQSKFYSKQAAAITEALQSRWAEGMPCLYDYVCFI